MKTNLFNIFFCSFFSSSFHHFPQFHVQNGEPGDTLIWDPRRNELLIADRDAQHRVLCFWKKHQKGHSCPPKYTNSGVSNSNVYAGHILMKKELAGRKNTPGGPHAGRVFETPA